MKPVICFFILLATVAATVNAAVPVFPQFLAEGIKAFEPPAGVPFSYCPNGVWQPGYVVVSAEAWWRRELVPQTGPSAGKIGGFDFGHVHNEVCVPHNLLPSTNTITAGTLLHQNNGNVSYVVLEDRWTNQWLQTAKFISPRSAANVVAAKGTVVDSTIVPNDPSKWTVRFNDTLTVNTSALNCTGLQRIRTLMIVKDPEMINGSPREQKAHFSWNFLVDDSTGKQPCKASPLDPAINSLSSIGWGTNSRYSLVEMYVPPKYPVGGLWRFMLHVNPATPDSLPINRTLITWNPNFHKDLPGTVVKNDTGGYWDQINMDVHSVLGANTQGWHKLVIQAKAIADDGATNTGALAYNMQISNGADCTKGAVQTHPFSDAWMEIKKTWVSKSKTFSYPAPSRNNNVSYYNYMTPKNTTAPDGSTNQKVLEHSYNLSFLSAPKGIASASVWMYVNNNTGAVGRTVYAFDGNQLNKTTSQPCVELGTCNPVGSGVLGAAGSWLELKFTNATFLNAANTSKTLKFWTALPSADSAAASVQIQAANNYGCPPLLVQSAC